MATQLLAQTERPAMHLVAEDIDGEAGHLVVNKLRGGLKVAAFKAQDSATAAKRCSKTLQLRGQAVELENVTLAMLGRVKKVTIDKEKTTIVSGAGKKADIRPASVRSMRKSRNHVRL